jgi:hypothetical protein
MPRAKAPVPTSTFTAPEWALPGDERAHRLKIGADNFLAWVSLCGLTVTAGSGEHWQRMRQVWGRAARERKRCVECEKAAETGND